jgi:hypothetical protein
MGAVTLTNLQEIVITTILRRRRSNVPSIRHARKLRDEQDAAANDENVEAAAAKNS